MPNRPPNPNKARLRVLLLEELWNELTSFSNSLEAITRQHRSIRCSDLSVTQLIKEIENLKDHMLIIGEVQSSGYIKESPWRECDWVGADRFEKQVVPESLAEARDLLMRATKEQLFRSRSMGLNPGSS